MAYEGMPDFQALVGGKEVPVLPPFAGEGAYTLLPHGLDISRGDDGTADFHMSIVRPENPMLPPAPYGMLDFRLQAVFAVEDGLALARAGNPGVVVQQALFRDGFVQISPVGEFSGTAPQLFAPVPVNFQGLGVTRFSMHLDLNSALLVKDMLQANVTPLRATAHLEVWGVAPRVPLQIRLDPPPFLEYLRSKADPGGLISHNGLVAAFMSTAGDVPWTIEGKSDQIEPATFAESMADHVRARFASLAPPQPNQGAAMLALASPEQFGSGTFRWDLNEPATTARVVSLTFDPLAAARALVASRGIEAVVSMDTVRRLQTGVVSASILASLPAQRQGVLSLGVTVKVPPKLPFRPQQINRTVELQEPRDSGTVEVQLSPKEKLAFTYQTFMILQDSTGMHRLEGKDTPHEGENLLLHVDDFPVNFIQIEASDRLLAAGAVSGTLSYDDSQTAFSVTAAQPRLTLAVPQDASTTSLDFEFRSTDGAHVLKLAASPARTFQLDLSSFREYGPQSLNIHCVFHEGTPLLAIDLLPESSSEAASNVAVVSMTPQSPQRQWTWFASSPFTPGYRYRVHQSGPVASAWSEVRSPFEPLLLDTAILSQAAAVGGQS